MTISYKKLWVMLAQNEMSKAELRRRAGLSPAMPAAANPT